MLHQGKVLEKRKHFSSSFLGYMLNSDLLKLFRLRTMTRISHFICLGKQLYYAYDLNVLNYLFFLHLFFPRFFFFYHMLFLEMWIIVYGFDRYILIFAYLYLLLRRNYVEKKKLPFKLSFVGVDRYIFKLLLLLFKRVFFFPYVRKNIRLI